MYSVLNFHFNDSDCFSIVRYSKRIINSYIAIGIQYLLCSLYVLTLEIVNVHHVKYSVSGAPCRHILFVFLTFIIFLTIVAKNVTD